MQEGSEIKKERGQTERKKEAGRERGRRNEEEVGK